MPGVETAEFTLTLKGRPDELSRVLRATMSEYQALEKEGRERSEPMLRFNVGDRFLYAHGPWSSLEGTLTLKDADAALLGWH